MIDKQIYTPEECADLFPFLDTLEIEYHKPYKRFNQIVKVPRGQASYTLDDTIHYDYKLTRRTWPLVNLGLRTPEASLPWVRHGLYGAGPSCIYA